MGRKCTLPDGRVSAAVAKIIMSRTLAAALIIMGVTAIATYGQSQRRAAGIVYFTNNTPKELRSFPVEILKGTNKKVAVTHLDEHYRFAFVLAQLQLPAGAEINRQIRCGSRQIGSCGARNCERE